MNCMICESSEASGYKTNGDQWADHLNKPKYCFCRVCAPLALRRFGKKCDSIDPNLDEWVEILKESWNGTAKCFQCQISHVPLNLYTPSSPLYATLDHVIPRSREGGWKLVASVINSMKTAMNVTEFEQATTLLASHFRNSSHGTDELNQVFAGLKHW